MRNTLAEKVFARVVDWDAGKLSKERLDLELLAELKYDEYLQFSAGMRFIESLSLWLGQFSESERDTMYNLVKKRLIFISNAEMQHCIEIAYSDYIKPILVKETARRTGMCEDHINKVTMCKEFRYLKKKCLYLGLSDGSKMDNFRRFSNLDHEQVYPSYEIAPPRQAKMMRSLAKSLKQSGEDARFEIVFLVDDFSASGLSYIRENGDGFDGKINAFLKQFIYNRPNPNNPTTTEALESGGLRSMLVKNPLIIVLLYVATDRAVAHIEQLAKKLYTKHGVEIKVVVVYKIDEEVASIKPHEVAQVESTLKKQFDDAVVTSHYKTGRHLRPYLGFDECGLLVVLSHNCPNNTLPIIWHDSDNLEIKGLFPRHQRFSGE